MTLSTGTKLSHYEITSQLGKGGMGEVYQAKDTKLGRNVAIKVLPEEFARDADRIARFQREAKLLASLNHPNIAAIYGLEESAGAHFLVMELVGGNTIDERIKSGPISVEEALKLALQIAEALEAAHEKGVIHRDLKPANIKVTPEGKVKVLDFGLAKAFAGEQGDLNLSNSPTLSHAATMQGVILGTAAYMSPEQARGKPVDKRADIWAFGAVLFEMLTGKSAFQGEDISEVLASVIKGDSNLALLPGDIHTRIHEVLARCLQKDLRKRYADIADVRYEIEQVLADPGGVYAPIAGMVDYREKSKRNLSWIAVALILTAVAAGLFGWMLRQEPPTQALQASKFSHILPRDEIFRRWNTNLAISPDGRNIVYSTNNGLYLRPVDAFQAVPISGSEKDSTGPFFSPDCKWIGFGSPKDRKMKKISINGGSPVILCDIEGAPFANWEENNRILFSGEEGIYQVSGDGGDPELVVPKENDYLSFPQMLPGGKAVLFTLLFGNRIAVQSLESGKRTILMPGTRARYLPTGHLVYFMDNDLYAVKFDPDKLEAVGGPVPTVQGVSGSNLRPDFDVSKTGTLVYIPGSPLSSLSQLEWYDREGNGLGSVGEPGPYEQFSLSPDETKVVIEKRTSDGYDLWVMELDRGGVEFPVKSGPSVERDPIWTRDGKFIIFNSNKDGPDHLYKRSLTTEEESELYAMPGNRLVAEDCSRDGRYLAYNISEWENRGIWILPLLDDPSPTHIVKGESNSDEPKFSPDGEWLAYVSNKTGEFEVWLVSLEGERIEHRVSMNGGGQPKWKGDQKELYYLAADGSLMAVPLKGEALTPGKPEILFKTNLIPSPTTDQYAVTGDGRHFLILNSEGDAKISAFNIVLNWFEELKDLVPVD